MTGLPQRLIYSSRFGPAFPSAVEDQEDEIGKIVRASIRNNRQVSISGLLLAHHGWFVQALEGPAQAIADTICRITTDDRHREVTVLGRCAAKREFAGWNMCARRISRADDVILESLGASAFDPGSWTPASALRVLIEIRDRQTETMTALI